MAGARWLRQRSNARKCEFAMKALTVWRAVPPCCHAVLAQSMRAQHASNTTARANYHTHLPSFKRPATRLRGHRVGDADDGTSRQRGAWDVSSNWAKITFIVSSLERPHRRGHRPGRHEHAKRRHEHASGDHEITSKKVHDRDSFSVYDLYQYHKSQNICPHRPRCSRPHTDADRHESKVVRPRQ